MNPDHLNELNKGPHSWNQWRKENANEKPDLGNTNLTGFDFTGYDLSMADLGGTQLIGANLNGVNLRNGDLKMATLFKANLSGADLIGVALDMADLSMADLSGTQLIGVDLRKTQLVGATLNGANLLGAILSEVDLRETKMYGTNLRAVDLQMANLNGANLSGANLSEANIKGLRARFSIVDGSTLLNECQTDRDTDFSGVGLDSARIEGSLKSELKRNVRQKYWERRYKENRFLNILRLFWWASDYGSSTTRIIWTFLGLSLLFSLLYLIPTPAPDLNYWLKYDFHYPFVRGLGSYSTMTSNGAELIIPLNFGQRFLRAVYFSVVTMTTLGFGDITPHPASWLGNILVILQVLSGYVLLGALITRLSILFQDVG